MSCSANSDLPMKIGIRIQSANTVLTQFDTTLISDKSFGAVCRSTHVQAVSLIPSGHHFTPWRCWSADYDVLISRSHILLRYGFCTKNANFDLYWKIEVCTSTQLHIRPSSPSYSIIGDLQWFRIVPAKPLRSNVVSLWSYLIPLSGSLPGHHFRPWGCWGAG